VKKIDSSRALKGWNSKKRFSIDQNSPQIKRSLHSHQTSTPKKPNSALRKLQGLDCPTESRQQLKFPVSDTTCRSIVLC
jgi:hypothetical protein